MDKRKYGNIIDFEYKNWTDKSKKTKEEKKATTIAKINLSIVVMYRNKTNTKQEKRERNRALDPDLNENQETRARELINYISDLIPKYHHIYYIIYNIYISYLII